MTHWRPGVWIGGAVLIAVLAGAWLAVIWHGVFNQGVQVTVQPGTEAATPAAMAPAAAPVAKPVAGFSSPSTPRPAGLQEAAPQAMAVEQAAAVEQAVARPVEHEPPPRSVANYPRHAGR